MVRFISDSTVSGRITKTPPNEVSEERYTFITLSETEPDLGVPDANGYILTSDDDGNRTWIDGSTIFGPQGIQGIQGIQGLLGVQGAQGLQGTKGDPFKVLGSVPDVNVNPPNDPQATLTAAFSSPSLADGVIDEATTDLWVWNGTDWINTGDIVGPQGIQGIQGISIQGTQGITGEQGVQGIQGIDGAQGAQGSQGVQGITGTGAQGIQGTDGTGNQGIQGVQGITGEQGVQGITGEQGIQGIQGTAIQGVQGITGEQGVQGVQGITGAGEQGIQGITGEQGIQGTDGTGNQGIQGITGEQGVQGITGEQGIQGITGAGEQGIQGITGEQGVQGVQGISGTLGSEGAQGTTGEQGIQGITGEQGIQGITGAQGTTGEQGVQGIQGSTAGDADTLDGLDSLQFLRTDVNTSMSAGFLTLANDPTSPFHAATKEYVDTLAAASLHYHDPVRVEKEGNLTVTYNNGTNGVGATLTNAGTQEALVIDDVTMVVGDRVLIYEQSDATQNGIYTVTNVGSGSTNWVLTRATDADSYGASDPNSFGEGDAFFVLEGTAGAGELYVMNTSGTITFGTTNITFAQVSSSQIYTAGSGLVLNGVEFSVNPSANITVSGVTVNGVGEVIDSNGDWVGDTAGLQGIQGITGAQGTTGDQGVQGIQGAGSDGAQGIQGITGADGAQGTTGEQGIQGIQGINGAQGTTGEQGIQGITGAGTQGTTGEQGIQGITGNQGIQGPESASASATELQATNDTSTDADFYPVFVAATGSVQTVTSTASKLYFNPSSGELSATSFNSLSDATVKENVQLIDDSFSMLDKIDTYKFNWKDTKELSYGVMAQELEKVMPELVRKNGKGQRTVSYIPLIAIMIDAINKLKEEVDRK